MQTKGAGALNGERYLERLRDGREVGVRGERVADVTRHPAVASVSNGSHGSTTWS